MTTIDNINETKQMRRKCVTCNKLRPRGYGSGYTRPRASNDNYLNSNCNDCASAIALLSRRKDREFAHQKNQGFKRRQFASRDEEDLKDAAFYKAHPTGEKLCRKCERHLGAEDFYNNRVNRDGKQGNCKSCHRAIMAEKAEEKEARAAETRSRLHEGTKMIMRKKMRNRE